MEKVLAEINEATAAKIAFIMPSFFARVYGQAAVNAAFRAADMIGYTKRGKVWFRD